MFDDAMQTAHLTRIKDIRDAECKAEAFAAIAALALSGESPPLLGDPRGHQRAPAQPRCRHLPAPQSIASLYDWELTA